MSKKKRPGKKKAGGDKAKRGGRFLARVYVSLKPTVNDPEGNTISGALASLGFSGIETVRSGRYFQIALTADDAKKAAKAIDQACDRLLANPVIETYAFELVKA